MILIIFFQLKEKNTLFLKNNTFLQKSSHSREANIEQESIGMGFKDRRKMMNLRVKGIL